MLKEIYKECPDWLKNTQRLKVIMHIQHIMKLGSTLDVTRRAYNKTH